VIHNGTTAPLCRCVFYKVVLTSSSAVGHSACQGIEHERALLHYYVSPTSVCCKILEQLIWDEIRDAPITHWPIIGRPIIGAKQSADYQPITD